MENLIEEFLINDDKMLKLLTVSISYDCLGYIETFQN